MTRSTPASRFRGLVVALVVQRLEHGWTALRSTKSPQTHLPAEASTRRPPTLRGSPSSTGSVASAASRVGVGVEAVRDARRVARTLPPAGTCTGWAGLTRSGPAGSSVPSAGRGSSRGGASPAAGGTPGPGDRGVGVRVVPEGRHLLRPGAPRGRRWSRPRARWWCRPAVQDVRARPASDAIVAATGSTRATPPTSPDRRASDRFATITATRSAGRARRRRGDPPGQVDPVDHGRAPLLVLGATSTSRSTWHLASHGGERARPSVNSGTSLGVRIAVPGKASRGPRRTRRPRPARRVAPAPAPPLATASRGPSTAACARAHLRTTAGGLDPDGLPGPSVAGSRPVPLPVARS